MRFIKILSGAAIVLLINGCNISDADESRLKAGYFQSLDAWVENPDLKVVEEQVIEPCGKLVMLEADSKVAMTTTHRDLFHEQVDICLKLVVQRVEPQPEFNDPKLVNFACHDNRPAFIHSLCRQASLL